jgi:hypothetical protein
MVDIFNNKKPILRAHCCVCEARYGEEEWLQIDYNNLLNSYGLFLRNDFYDKHGIRQFKDLWRLSKKDYKTVNWFELLLTKKQLNKIYSEISPLVNINDIPKDTKTVIIENNESIKFVISTEFADNFIVEYNKDINDYSIGVGLSNSFKNQKEFRKYFRKLAFKYLFSSNINYGNIYFEFNREKIVELVKILKLIKEDKV